MKKLKTLRLGKKATQQQIADYLGVSRQAYCNYENGNRTPDNETLLKLAEFHDVSVDYLLREETEAVQTTVINEKDIIAAFFEGADNLSPEEQDMLWRDAKEYIGYKLEQRRRNK